MCVQIPDASQLNQAVSLKGLLTVQSGLTQIYTNVVKVPTESLLKCCNQRYFARSRLPKYSPKICEDVVATRICQVVQEVGNGVLVGEHSLGSKTKDRNPTKRARLGLRIAFIDLKATPYDMDIWPNEPSSWLSI